MKYSTAVFAFLLFQGLSLPLSSLAYEVDTHKLISEKALSASDLVKSVAKMKQLGLLPVGADERDQSFPNSKGVRKNIRDLVTEGAEFEDQPAWRVSNHFFNPLNNQPLTLKLGLFDKYLGATSPDWTILGTGLFPLFPNDFSYKSARNYFYKALTDPSRTERDKNFGKTFESIGRIVHHLQDMAQPQHVRNDQHLELSSQIVQEMSKMCLDGVPILDVCDIYAVIKTPSRFEEYTNKSEVRNRLPFGGYDPVYSSADATTFTTPRQFWTGASKGIADYTNRGFVSAGTNFTGTAASILPATGLPKPDGVGAQVIKVAANDPTLFGAGTLKSGSMWFISTPVHDQYRASSSPATNPRTSTYSLYDHDLMAINKSPVFSLNRFNFEEAHKLLIPRAVGYSAGLINYFFRGSMEITPPTEGVYGIVDHSTIRQIFPKNGFEGFRTIKLKVRNTTPGGEAMTGGKLVAVAKFRRNECYKDDLSGEFTQDDAGNLINPCPNETNNPNAPVYRSHIEEIVVSTSVKNAAGTVLDTVSLDTSTATQFTFSFDTAIPINATDLFIQVVYRGALGSETDAVVVATKDVFEPTFLALLNATDQFLLNGKFVPATDPALIPIFDGNNDNKLDDAVKPTTLGINFGFKDSFAGASLGFINFLPPARFSRLALLTDRSPFNAPLQAFGSQSGSAFNSVGIYGFSAQIKQVEPESGLFMVSPVEKIRGISAYYVLPFYFYYGTTDFGDHKTLPALVDKTPFPVTLLNFQ